MAHSVPLKIRTYSYSARNHVKVEDFHTIIPQESHNWNSGRTGKVKGKQTRLHIKLLRCRAFSKQEGKRAEHESGTSGDKSRAVVFN